MSILNIICGFILNTINSLLLHENERFLIETQENTLKLSCMI